MFDFVRNNRRVVQLVLAGITLPFALFGVDWYFRQGGANGDPASVGGSKVTAQEFQQALRDQQERMAAATGGRAPREMFETPEFRRGVIEGLVNQRLLNVFASKARLMVSDDQLVQLIGSVPLFQENGKFSRERYEAFVAARGMSKEGFEARLRQDLMLQQAAGVIGEATLPGKVATDRWLATQLEQREVSSLTLKPEQFTGQVKLAADAVKTYYDAHRQAFELPEQVKVEYLVLSPQAFAAQATPSEADVKAWYQNHQEQFKEPEQRRASHILIVADKAGGEAAVKAAQAKAEEVLAKVKGNPKEFGALAKQYSQDPGSAAKGGDLDWFARGMMVKPFEEAVFSMKEGDLSGIVRSDFGFHIIKLTGVRGNRAKAFDEVRAEVAEQLKQEAATKKYAENAEGFTNMVYEQSDSLQPAAEKFKLIIAKSDWIAKGAQVAGPLGHPKLNAALFSDDAVKSHRNTEAVEVMPSVMVAARVIEHKPAALRPLEEVQAQIEKKLLHEEAAKLAAKAGADKIDRLAKGEAADASWGPAKLIPRLGVEGVAPEAMKAIFQAHAEKLPAYAGAALADGAYMIFRISQVKAYGGGADSRSQLVGQQYARAVADEEFAAWLAVLRARFPVEINEKAIAAKDR